MVRIINGEIVPDDDPRVRAQLQPQQNQLPHRRFGYVHGSKSSVAPSGSGTRAPPAPGLSPLEELARQVGLDGTLVVPAVLGFPARPILKIYVVMGVLLTAVFGWRALVFLCFAYFLIKQQPSPTQ
ncbi:hypothetical protein CCR75_007100 [Bremia lactucae]|uniref:Uncharacterized protein n=1 Tax=Bremia lactucae TaxID=4779 RepID=A0A976FPP1_BRELC|nr:hypothetical protein CCR75_007100 [Bremia lactucae]